MCLEPSFTINFNPTMFLARKEIPLLYLLLFVSLFFASSCNSQNEQPNFIIIYCDDLGYGDIGTYGNTTHRTPHLAGRPYLAKPADPEKMIACIEEHTA